MYVYMYMLAYMLLLSSRCMLCVVYTPRQVYAVLLRCMLCC
jgi:hypothetical protein